MDIRNTFADAARIESHMTETENGHAALRTTGSHLLDLYGQVGGLRGQDFETRVLPLFKAAISEDKLLTTKIMFYARDARGGVGERELFRQMLRYCADKYPEMVRPNLHLVPFFGRWDDLYSLIGTKLEPDALGVMYAKFAEDAAAHRNKKPVSLLAKWLKSVNSSSEETRRLGKLTAKYFCLTERNYRKLLSALREDIRIVERDMSARNWGEIEYEKIPSRAGMIYRKAFERHDEERYNAYIESVNRGEKKINAAMNTPQDLVHAICPECRGVPAEDPTIEAMWKNLPDFVKTDENILCMVDVSGSMTGRPMEISTGLGMYFAQHNKGAFHNLFMTFESQPQFQSMSDHESFARNLRNVLRAPWGGSTNLNAACEKILHFAVANHVPQMDMPTRLIIISDMEIDSATGSGGFDWETGRRLPSGELHIDELRKMYTEAGYEVPQVIYWNAESRDNHFQTKSDTKGVMLASGSSPAVFEAVLAMKDLQVMPLDAMLEVLNGERYSAIVIDEAGA